MLRARLGILVAGIVVVLAAGAASAGGAAGPAEPVAPTTVAPTTVPATTAATTTTTPAIVGPVLTAPPRGGAPAGTTAKPADEEWTLRQVGTTVGIIVAALALIGFVYGRIRSTTPRSTVLARTSD
jgi:heme A synthase